MRATFSKHSEVKLSKQHIYTENIRNIAYFLFVVLCGILPVLQQPLYSTGMREAAKVTLRRKQWVTCAAKPLCYPPHTAMAIRILIRKETKVHRENSWAMLTSTITDIQVAIHERCQLDSSRRSALRIPNNYSFYLRLAEFIRPKLAFLLSLFCFAVVIVVIWTKHYPL